LNIYIVAASDAEKDEKRRLRWGDYWFKDSLSKALVAQGHTVSADPGECDVLINCHGSGIENLPVHTYNVLWVIGHPDRVTANECAQYDAVYSESDKFAVYLRKRGIDCGWMPGASDFVALDLPKALGRVFVGNNRQGRSGGALRDCIADLNGDYTGLAVWGEGWESLPKETVWKGLEFPHDQLNSLYAQSVELLNDVHPDMEHWGMHNPRHYDILATRGEPVPTFAECAARIMAGVPEKRIMFDLGCGAKVRRGMVGIDKCAAPGVEEYDLEAGIALDGTVDVFVADNLFEHIHNFLPLMNGCLRSLKRTGRLHITVPNVAKSIDAAFSDPTHVRQFTPQTFDYFNGEHARWAEYGKSYGILPWRVLYARERDGRFIDVMLRPA
jgi:SAM-dependent methyltransferase